MHSSLIRKVGLLFVCSSLLVLPISTASAQAATLQPASRNWSRSELADALMTNLHLTPSSIGPIFHDVSSRTPDATAIETVTGDLLMQGVGPFTFAPNRLATQIDLAQALENALGLKDTVSLLKSRPLTRDATAIPTVDWGIVDAALQLHLLPTPGGNLSPNAPVTTALFQHALAMEKATSPAQVAAVADSVANAAWVGFPYWENASQSLNVGTSIAQIAYEVENGELVLPGQATLTASTGTLTASGAYTAPEKPGVSTITATVDGTNITQTLPLLIYAPDQVSFASDTASVMTVKQKVQITGNVLSQNPNDLANQVIDPADSGRKMTLTITGPNNQVTVVSAQDDAGQAVFSFTPTTPGLYSMRLAANGLPAISDPLQVAAQPIATASLHAASADVTYGQSVPVSVYLQPIGQQTLPAYLPITLAATGSGSLQSVVQSVYTYAAEQAGGTPVAAISGGASPGPTTISISTPGNAFVSSTTSNTGILTGSIAATVPAAALPAGSDVTVSATLTLANGKPAPAGVEVYFTPVAPDGEEGLLSTRSEDNYADALTNSAGVATVQLADQYMSGVYSLSVSANGYSTDNTSYRITAGPAVKLDAVIAPSPFLLDGHSAHISVAAVDRYGNPVPGFALPVHISFTGHDGYMTLGNRHVVGQGIVATVTAGAGRGQDQVDVASAAFPGQVIRLPMIVITNPIQLLEGKGTWATYNVYGAMGAQAMIKEMKAEGMTHLYLETAASGAGFYGQLPLDRLVDAAHQAGIAVITWSYAALQDVQADESSAQAALDYQTRLGSTTDGYTGDFEQNLNSAAMQSYSAFIRKVIGPNGLYVATIFPPQDGYATPLSTLAHYVTAFAPMDYWHGKEQDYTFGQVYSYVANSISEIEQAAPHVPIEVIAQAYDIWSNSGTGVYNPSAIEEEAAIMAAQASGAQGISFYDLQTLSASQAVALSLPYPLP